MNKTIIIIFTLFLSAIGYAETYNIIVSGKGGGTFHTRSMLMHDALEDAGHSVNLINAGNLAKAAQVFKTTEDTVMMPWIDSANLKENLQPDHNTFGVLEYTAPIVFCTTKYTDFNAPKIQIGYSASWPIEIFVALEETLGKEIDPIPYRNSGDLVLGFTSKEIDYIAISMSKLTKLPAGSCFAVTNDVAIENIPPLAELLPNFQYSYIKQHAYWLVKNADNDFIDAMIKGIQSANYSNWITSKSFVPGKFEDDDLHRSQQGAVDWGLK